MASAPSFSDAIICPSTSTASFSSTDPLFSSSSSSFSMSAHLNTSDLPLWRRRDVAVFVNIYDLHPYNQYVNCLGLGAHHSGIEIFGREYSYGFHQFDTTGVFDNAPRMAFGAVFNTSVFCGIVHLSEADFESILRSLRPRFLGYDYDILMRNCNHFSVELVKALGLKSTTVPAYVNRLAWLAKAIRCCLPRTFIRPQDVIDPDQAFIQPPVNIVPDASDSRQKLKGSIPVINYHSTGSSSSLVASIKTSATTGIDTSIQSSTSSSYSSSSSAIHEPASPPFSSDSFQSAWSDSTASAPASAASKRKSKSPPPSSGSSSGGAQRKVRFDELNASPHSFLLLKHAAQSPSNQFRNNLQKRMADEKSNEGRPVLPSGEEEEEENDNGATVSDELRAQQLQHEFYQESADSQDHREEQNAQRPVEGRRSDEEKNPFIAANERRTSQESVGGNDEGQVNPFEQTPTDLNQVRIQS